MAHGSQDLEAIQKGLENVNAACKTATEAISAQGDDVQDVEFEEVK